MVMAPEGRVETRPERIVLRSGKLTKERLPIVIEATEDRPERLLQGWVVKSMRYPASVGAELEDARLLWEATWELIQPEDAPPVPSLVEAVKQLIEVHDTGQSLEQLTESVQILKAAVRQQEQPQFRKSAVEFEAYVTRCLMILIPGLEEWEADLLDPECRLGWLRDLGYFRPNNGNAGGAPEAPATHPPDESPSSIGAEQGPGSLDSTE